MSGNLKTSVRHFRSKSSKSTNFNDWSDPKCKSLPTNRHLPRCTKQMSSKRDSNKETDKLEDEEDDELLSMLSQIPQSKVSQTSAEIDQLREKIRRGSPLLSRKEIRIFKMPFHESLIYNMKDDGFVGSSLYLSDLIMMDEEWHLNQKINPNLKNRLYLKSNHLALNVLSEGLMQAEVANRENQKAAEIKALLKIAVHFSDPIAHSWHWLAEELYEQCIATTEKSFGRKTSVEELIAMAKHGYASFLLEVLHEPEQAKTQVEESMEMSVGKVWKPDDTSQRKDGVLYLESCVLLHKTYMALAQEKKSSNMEEAIQLCRDSLHWARQGGCKKSEANAILLLVITYMEAGKLEFVNFQLEKYMDLCKELNNNELLCDGYIVRAKYHEYLGRVVEIIHDLSELLKVAEESNNLKMVAISHRKLATIYLILGKQEETLEHATKAYNCYITLENQEEKNESRCLTAVAQGQEVIADYIELIADSEQDCDELRVLISWKMLHIPFFSKIKLFQPEAETNQKLRNNMQKTKHEETVAASKLRQYQMGTSQLWNKQQQRIQKASSGLRLDTASKSGTTTLLKTASYNVQLIHKQLSQMSQDFESSHMMF